MTSSLRKLEKAASDIDEPSRMCSDVREALKQGKWMIVFDEVQRARALNPLGFNGPRTSNGYHWSQKLLEDKSKDQFLQSGAYTHITMCSQERQIIR